MRVKDNSQLRSVRFSFAHYLNIVVARKFKIRFASLNYAYEGGARSRKVLVFCAKSILSSYE